ncbi:MAG: hypothetical protein ACO4B6_08015, partial [Ilumatobacteraceae bacterium]
MPKWLTRSPLPTMFAVAAVVAASGAIGLTAATGDRIAEVERIEGLEVVLAEKPVDEVGEPIEVPPTENYLLVGSDSREGITADDPDFGAIGATSIVT